VILTTKQEEARAILNSPAGHILGEGGSRSGKTVLIVRNIVVRALKAKGSRHVIFRYRFSHVKESIGMETLPWVMAHCFPGVPAHINKGDWYLPLPGGSEIWLAGLDDKERTEKVLGREYATIFLNEVSQIPWGSRNMAVTRLAQKVPYTLDGKARTLALKMYYDCNPPSKTHWVYKMFREHLDPDSRTKLSNPENYRHFRINPVDNRENLPSEYLAELQRLPERLQRRFYRGEYGDAVPGAFWTEELFDRSRVTEYPDLIRLLVSIDPSGAGEDEDEGNDEIGIMVGGLGTDGQGYLLEDLTVKGPPEVWGKVATDALDRHAGDAVVGETNFGGDMVRFVVQAAKPQCPFRKVTASRGKAVRAEPISVLHERGKIKLVGHFPELEDELLGFSKTGYSGKESPNRADAFVWLFSELFPGIARAEKKAARGQRVETMPWSG
jgi:Phage terminase large subunit